MTQRLRRTLRASAVGLLALAGITCRDRSASGLGMPFPAALAVAPGVSSIVGGPAFDLVGVRVTLSDFPDDRLVLDTVAEFTAGGSELRLALAVQLMRPSQDFYLRIAAVDILGDTLFRSVDTVTLRQAEASPQPATVSLKYSGPDTLVAAISIAPRDTSILVGVPLLMRPTAIGFDQAVLESVRYGWRSSDPGAMTVAPDGTVLALKPVQGAWIVATTANGRTDSTQVSADLPAQLLRITPDTATLGVDATLKLSVAAEDVLGTPLALPAGLVWSSEDSRIAIVSLAGEVTGLTAGTTRIIALAGTLKGAMQVTVVLPGVSVASIDIDSVFAGLAPGDSVLLRATVRDVQGMPVTYPITWSALDTNISVDSRGMVIARSAGSGRVMATAEKMSDTTTITVFDPQLVVSPPPRSSAP